MLFLGNIQPDLQRQVRAEATGARFVGLDSMNLWIDTARDSLIDVIGQIDCLLLNDAELRMLTGEPNLVVAAHRIMESGPGTVVVKRGEYGAALFTGDDTFAMPALPLAEVRDPTGAGDSFAGGFLGFLDGLGAHQPSNAQLRQAMVMGSAMASFNVEDFGTDRVRRLGRPEIDARVAAFKALTHF
jgi:sugar/nucleoside kinase (ribokinase family)